MADTTAPTETSAVPREPAVKRWQPPAQTTPATPVREVGGRKDGTDPTRYGDWEKNGRCIDF